MAEEKAVRSFNFSLSPSMSLFNENVAFANLQKSLEDYQKKADSILNSQGYMSPLPHPIDRMKALFWMDMCAPFSTCVTTKASCTVGLGFISDQEAKSAELEAEQVGLYSSDILQFIQDPSYIPSKVDEAFDPLCEVSFADLLGQTEQSAWATGNGYIEVRRDETTGKIIGLHFIEPQFIWKVLEEDGNYHYRYQSFDNECYLSRFGKEEHERVARLKRLKFYEVSEVIDFPFTSVKSRYYGYPDWVGCIPAMELYLSALQEKFDEYRNKCVMDFMLFIIGPQMTDNEWKSITSGLQSATGIGNAHKSLITQLPYDKESFEFKFFPITKESKTDEGFSKMFEDCRGEILSAHGVPPLLAGVLIPGKLGANNEFVNALMSLQSLKIGKRQKTVTKILQKTLGAPEEGFNLRPSEFNFRKITDYINMKIADTTSRMRQGINEAIHEGRDLTEGVRD